MLGMTQKRYFILTVAVSIILVFAASFTAKGQNLSEIRINEYYWNTPLEKVIKDFRDKYHVRITYDSAMVQHFTFDYLFTNTPVPTALDVVFRNNPELAFFIDDKGNVKVISRAILNASKLTAANLKFMVSQRDSTLQPPELLRIN